jgi:hypothetical protein
MSSNVNLESVVGALGLLGAGFILTLLWLVFDLPSDTRCPALLVGESLLPTRFIIGHENSLLHRRTRFRLEP